MRWRLILILLFSLASAVLINWPENWQPLLDEYYGGYLYPLIQRGLAAIPAPGRFPLVDILWLAIPLLLIVRLLFIARKHAILRIGRMIVECGLWASAGLLMVMLLWGVNYQRPTLKEHLLNQGFATTLAEGHWQFAVAQTNEVTARLAGEYDLCSTQPHAIHPARPAAFAHSAMAQARLTPPPVSRNVNASRWSYVYQRLRVAGFYSALTGEPTYSDRMYPYAIPFVALHEYAHWAGYAPEYDADIIGYWSAWLSPDPLWQYSAWLMWWADVGVPRELAAQLDSEFRKGLLCLQDYNRNQQRWDINKLAWKTYEQGLKAQGVTQGLAAYGEGEAIALTSYQDWLFKARNRAAHQ
ncbi:DUF3810 family protein [Reinekea marinisedimentorum]|uniref:Uncharacterized protein DUF3810 n=1 Tax=Reinekea marinisedimentorum TaxID=230495 RepID=A0A4R3IC86_9GAMM|nr:DUF3810 family protein [Reinekea marinisedimentorum]TCS43235.1 uncharacterized protein DUF3810 [Reinekea marinisedimentorum]